MSTTLLLILLEISFERFISVKIWSGKGKIIDLFGRFSGEWRWDFLVSSSIWAFVRLMGCMRNDIAGRFIHIFFITSLFLNMRADFLFVLFSKRIYNINTMGKMGRITELSFSGFWRVAFSLLIAWASYFDILGLWEAVLEVNRFIEGKMFFICGKIRMGGFGKDEIPVVELSFLEDSIFWLSLRRLLLFYLFYIFNKVFFFK